MKYEAPGDLTHEAAESLAAADEPVALSEALIALALGDGDVAWTAQFLLRFRAHPNANVRGNALLGFGHLARRFRTVPDRGAVTAAITAGLADPDTFVRGQADAAADDFAMFIGPLA